MSHHRKSYVEKNGWERGRYLKDLLPPESRGDVNPNEPTKEPAPPFEATDREEKSTKSSLLQSAIGSRPRSVSMQIRFWFQNFWIPLAVVLCGVIVVSSITFVISTYSHFSALEQKISSVDSSSNLLSSKLEKFTESVNKIQNDVSELKGSLSILKQFIPSKKDSEGH